MATQTEKQDHDLQLVLAWGFVGIPLMLGRAANAQQCDEAVPIGQAS